MPNSTVSDVLQKVFKDSKNFKCLPYDKRSVDTDAASEYAEVDKRIKGKTFEDPANNSITEVPTLDLDVNDPSILTYFMDGSRRVFRFSDVVLDDGRYYPILAGQVGVAVLERKKNGSMAPMNQYVSRENILVLPDTIEQPDRLEIKNELSARMRAAFDLGTYPSSQSGGNASEDYITKATKTILDRMHDLELIAVDKMMKNVDLRAEAMLVVDGSLQFRKEVLRRNSFRVDQLENVIGISKSFTPSQPVTGMKSGKHLGSILQELEFGHRTPVFDAGRDDFANKLGVWYLRIRPRQQMTNPLAGVLKIEIIARGSEKEDGFDRDRVDTLSAMIMSERNVTPYGADERWANHLYPIYLTETYLKSCFLSDVYFKGLL